MRKNELIKSLGSAWYFEGKPGPDDIEAFKNFLNTSEIKARKQEDDISFAEFVAYLEKNNQQALLERILNYQSNLAESKEQNVVFFRDFIQADIKGNIEKSSKSPLEEIPQDVATYKIGPRLAPEELGNLVRTSKTMHALFQRSINEVKLRHFMEEANYQTVLEMVKKNPLLMFQDISVDGKEKISPLKLAVKLLDVRMLKMFEDLVKDNSPLHKRFLKQVNEQKGQHIDLKPLFDAYETYDKKLALWKQGGIDESDLNKAWSEIGLAQRDVLPRHMLKTWHAASTTDSSDLRPTIEDVVTATEGMSGGGVYFSYLMDALAQGTTLTRGRSMAISFEPSPIQDVDILAEDINTFNQLYNEGKKDLDKLLQAAPEVPEDKPLLKK